MSISLLYQNVRGLRTKTHSLTTAITSIDADAVCITESWLNDTVNDAELCQSGYQVFRRDRDGIQAVRIREFESQVRFMEDLWIRINLRTSSLYICIVYFTPTNDHHRYLEHFRAVTAAIDEMGEDAKVIMAGDYNMPTLNWNFSDRIMELWHTG